MEFKSSLPMISVVVCTYNRAELLANVLRTLCGQTIDSSCYEVIVVDNNSEDNTRSATEEFCLRYHNVRYCLETIQGLSHARNRGWREAQGEYVAYIDDDCEVPEQWLAVAKDIIVRLSPGVFGGPFYAFYNTHKPRWYKDSYGSHEPFKKEKVLNKQESVNIYGGNMFFRRTLLQRSGGFNTELGMSGKKISYGEETALMRLISNTMPDQLIYYDTKLYLYHLVQAKKMTMKWIVCSSFARGRTSYYASATESISGLPLVGGKLRLTKRTLGLLRTIAVDIARSIFRRDRKQYLYAQNYFYERASQDLVKLGKIWEQYHHS